MIARPRTSHIERETIEMGASKVGNVSPFSCPGNEPWGKVDPNSALQIWDNTPESWRFLRTWWHTDAAPLTHPYEQAALGAAPFQGRVNVLSELDWMNHWNWDRRPAVHIGSLHKRHRVRYMQAAVARTTFDPSVAAFKCPLLADAAARFRSRGWFRRCLPAPPFVVRQINATRVMEEAIPRPPA